MIARGFDVLLLAARHWGTLPLHASLACRLRAADVRFTVTNDRAVYEALRACNRPVFGPLEFEFLSVGAAYERANPHSLFEWCVAKRLDPTWRLQLDDVMDRVRFDARHTIQIGRVLRLWGVELERVVYGAEVPT